MKTSKAKDLSPKQLKALGLLVSGATQEKAAEGAGVTVYALREWYKVAAFTDELRLALERMRQTFEARVMGLANNAAVVVQEMIEDDKDHERQMEGAKIAFNAAVRLSNRYKELQVEGFVAPAQPLVVFPAGTKFPWQNQAALPSAPLEIESGDIIDAEETSEAGQADPEGE